MDLLSNEEVDKFDKKKKEKYDSRYEVGDIIIATSNDHIWGKLEKRPQFVIVKIIDLNIEEAKQYTMPLIKNDKIKKNCKYRLSTDIFNYSFNENDCCEIDIDTFNNLLITKNN